MSEWIRKQVTESEVECGKAIVTEYFDAANTVVRRDTEIVVDPEKLPKVGAEIKFP